MEEKLAACSIFIMLMALTALYVSAVMEERTQTLENVEEKVTLRTKELVETMESLREAQMTAEKLSRQKSEFLVSISDYFKF